MQRNSAHYLQRPDKTYARYDPVRRRWTAGTAFVRFARTGGTHWLWNVASNIESPEFEVNDIGRLMAADGITALLS